jgi:hypothetical protein
LARPLSPQQRRRKDFTVRTYGTQRILSPEAAAVLNEEVANVALAVGIVTVILGTSRR